MPFDGKGEGEREIKVERERKGKEIGRMREGESDIKSKRD